VSKRLGAENCSVVGNNEDLQDAALRVITAAKADDPFAAVTMIVPNRSGGWLFSRQLASRMESGSALVNVRTITAVEFIQECAAALDVPVSEGGDPITRAAVLESALRRSSGELGPSAEHPETAVRLGRLMDQLRWCPLEATDREALADQASPTARAAIDFIAEVRSEVTNKSGGLDLVDVSRRIVLALEESDRSPAGIAALGTVVLVDQTLPAPLWDVVTSLEQPVHRIRLAVEREDIPAQVMGVPDPGTEAAMAVRFAAQAIAEDVPPERIAVVYSSATPYATVLARAFEDADIEWHGPGAGSLRQTMLARRVDALLELAHEYACGRGVPRPSLMKWLALRPNRSGADEPHPNEFRALIRGQSLYGDARKWLTSLTSLHEKAQELAELDESELDRRMKAQLQDGQRANDLAAALQQLVEYIKAIVGAESWTQIAQAVEAALARYSPTDESKVFGAEAAAVKFLDSMLSDSLPLVDSLVDAESPEYLQPSAETLRTLIDRELSRASALHGSAAVGVRVGPVSTMRGLTFDRVVIVGAADGLLPSVSRTGALLTDVSREILRKSPADAPTVVELEDAERIELMALVEPCSSLVVTFPRGAIPGTGVDQVARYFTTSDGEHRTRIASYEASLRHGPQPANQVDVILRQQMAGESGTERDEHLVRVAHSWAKPSFDDTFGNLDPEALSWRVSDDAMSASGIESFLRCPYHFFVERILRFETDTYDDEVDQISSSDLGTLIHAALEQLVRQATAEGWLPAAGEPWGADAHERGADIFQREARSAETQGLTGWWPAWSEAREEVIAALPQFFAKDNELRSEPPMSPGLPEEPFGMHGRPPAEITLASGAVVKLKGMIDRLDVSPDGTSARVIDYKSGKKGNFKSGLSEKKTDYHGRQKIQDLVYSLAVQQMRPELANVLVTFFFMPNQGEVDLVNPDEPTDAEADLRQILTHLEEAADSGEFPPNMRSMSDFCPVCSKLGRRALRATAAYRDLDVVDLDLESEVSHD